MGKQRCKKGQEFATLTDILTQAWSGNTVKEYKQLKGLKKENLRDNMTNLELVLNMLAEATTTEISKEKKPVTFDESRGLQNRAARLPAIPGKKSKRRRAKRSSAAKMQKP